MNFTVRINTVNILNQGSGINVSNSKILAILVNYHPVLQIFNIKIRLSCPFLFNQHITFPKYSGLEKQQIFWDFSLVPVFETNTM
jgi:hypothetical protein